MITALAVLAVGLAVIVAYALGAAVGGGKKEPTVATAQTVGRPPYLGISPSTAYAIAALANELRDAEEVNDYFEECDDETEPAHDGPNLDLLDEK